MWGFSLQWHSWSFWYVIMQLCLRRKRHFHKGTITTLFYCTSWMLYIHCTCNNLIITRCMKDFYHMLLLFLAFYISYYYRIKGLTCAIILLTDVIIWFMMQSSVAFWVTVTIKHYLHNCVTHYWVRQHKA